MSKKNKIVSYFIVIIAWSFAALLYFEASMKGFPDGHLTELARAEKLLFFVTSFILGFMGLLLVYLAWFAKSQNRNKVFYQTTFFLFVTILIVVSLDMFFISTLDNGSGG